jgi:hypothetical protein
MRIRMVFQEVVLRTEKSGHCSVCRKAAVRSKKFSQTLNPYNKNEAGVPKTRDEIMSELREESAEWHQQPTVHARCERVS